MLRSRLNRRPIVTATGTTRTLVLAGCADWGPSDDNETAKDEESDTETRNEGEE